MRFRAADSDKLGDFEYEHAGWFKREKLLYFLPMMILLYYCNNTNYLMASASNKDLIITIQWKSLSSF
jgi:hypothetical protein